MLIADEPLLAGAVKATEAEVADGVMELMVGIPGAKASDEVITRLPVPVAATATKSPLP